VHHRRPNWGNRASAELAIHLLERLETWHHGCTDAEADPAAHPREATSRSFERGEKISQFRRILYASDFSPASRTAFRQALDLARDHRAVLTVAHVYSTVVPLMGEGLATAQVYQRWLAEIRGDAQRRLDRLVAQARKQGVRAKGLLLEGVPHDRILRAARSTRADLIVLGTHSRTGLGRVLLGSVAARVVALARCPVLTVRAK
jgi:nucleotide-binding universal stress UspA family protein